MQSKKILLRGAATVLAGSFLALTVAACGKRGHVGVAECDDYFKAVDTCKNDAEKESLKAEADSNKENWKLLAQDKVKEACVARGNYAKERCDAGPDGVAECDEYFKILSTCKNETQKTNEKNNREIWKSQPRKTVQENCKRAVDMAKTFCK